VSVAASAAGTVVGVVIGLWLVGGAIYGCYLFARWLRDHGVGFRMSQLSDEEKERRRELRGYNKQVQSIQRVHDQGISQARAALNRAEKDSKKRLRSVEKQLEKARQPEKLDGLWSAKGWARLYEDRIETNKGTFALTPNLVVDVNSTGNLAIGGRSTLTRMGTGAIVAGPLGFMVGMAAKKDRKVDTRELYLIVQNESGGAVIACSPDHGEKVRQFALNIMGAAAQAPTAATQRRKLVAELEADLAHARHETAIVIDSARRDYDAKKAEPLALPPPPTAAQASSLGESQS
jgi:hypothetical protein